VLRWDETDGSVSVFRHPSMHANGHTVDLFGRLVSCEHRSRCVSRAEFDGRRIVLAERYEGKRFNSPNDVVVKSGGSIWFTDPSYGIDSDYEGDAAPSEIHSNNVYRIDAEIGRVSVVVSDFVQPNGLAFSPDESLLYIADTGLTHVIDGPAHVRRFSVSSRGASPRPRSTRYFSTRARRRVPGRARRFSRSSPRPMQAMPSVVRMETPRIDQCPFVPGVARAWAWCMRSDSRGAVRPGQGGVC
jgi:hypothetical protein